MQPLSRPSLRRGLAPFVRLSVRVAMVVFLVWVIASFRASFGEYTNDFTDLPGPAARQRFEELGHGEVWPAGIDLAAVQNVSRKHAATIDSHSVWYRIALAPPAAEAWRENMHVLDERTSKGAVRRSYKKVEGVHRDLPGPPPLRRQTGSTPRWWTPPASNVRATEAMLWYADFSSGYGRATYSVFDESTNVLWIYEYGRPHDKLWSPGNVPQGMQFTAVP